MGNQNALASESVAVLATIDPDALTAATHSSDWVAMKDFERALAVVMVGTLGSSATVDAKLQQATDSSGTGAKDVSSKSITQLTDAGTDSDKQALINIRGDELDVANGFDYVRLQMIVATATSDGSGMVLGINPRYAPASDSDLSTVDEIVS